MTRRETLFFAAACGASLAAGVVLGALTTGSRGGYPPLLLSSGTADVREMNDRLLDCAVLFRNEAYSDETITPVATDEDRQACLHLVTSLTASRGDGR